MVTSSSNDSLAKSIRRALLPPRFPERRDVVIGAAVAEGAGVVSFHDHFWLDRHILAVAAVRLAGAGVEGALEASAFRQLLRAALGETAAPEAALSLCAAFVRPAGLAAAVATLDTSSGRMASGAMGDGRVRVVPSAARSDRLSPGGIVWLAAGDFPPPASTLVPVEGLDALVRSRAAGATAGCVAAILFKAPARAPKAATFVVPNDPAEIPGLLRTVSLLLTRHSIPEEQVEGIDVALDEVLTNSVNYAFRDGQHHEMLVSVAVEPGQVAIEVRDDGAPFDPLALPAPDLSADIDEREVGGLGMHFVRTLLDHVSYQRSNGWNVLRLEKRLRSIHLQETE